MLSRIRAWFGIRPAPEAPPESPVIRDTAGAPPIGVAWMEKDRTVYVRIRLEQDGTIGDVNLRFGKRHPRYKDVVAYLGGIKPGEAMTIAEFDVRPH